MENMICRKEKEKYFFFIYDSILYFIDFVSSFIFSYCAIDLAKEWKKRERRHCPEKTYFPSLFVMFFLVLFLKKKKNKNTKKKE
jgi:hypothetical protein